MGFIGLVVYLLFLLAIFVAGGHAYRVVNKRYRQAKNPRYYQDRAAMNIVGMLTNDRALAIGLLAALLSVSVHNFVDDLYVHSLTNLIALLLIALIRLERVTFDYGG